MPDDARNNAATTRVIGRPFQPGNPGRPLGSRNALGEDFVKALYDDFKVHGVESIVKVRETDPAKYLKTIADVIPKEITLRSDPMEQLSDGELAAQLRELNRLISLAVDRGDEEGGAVIEGESHEILPPVRADKPQDTNQKRKR